MYSNYHWDCPDKRSKRMTFTWSGPLLTCELWLLSVRSQEVFHIKSIKYIRNNIVTRKNPEKNPFCVDSPKHLDYNTRTASHIVFPCNKNMVGLGWFLLIDEKRSIPLPNHVSTLNWWVCLAELIFVALKTILFFHLNLLKKQLLNYFQKNMACPPRWWMSFITTPEGNIWLFGF